MFESVVGRLKRVILVSVCLVAVGLAVAMSAPMAPAFAAGGPANTLYVVNSGNGQIADVSTAGNIIGGWIYNYAGSATAVAVSPNGEYLYITNGAGGSGTLMTYSLASQAVVSSVSYTLGNGGGNTAGIAVSPSGNQVMVVGSVGAEAFTVSGSTLTAQGQLPNVGGGLAGTPSTFGYSPNAEYFYAAMYGCASLVQVWSMPAMSYIGASSDGPCTTNQPGEVVPSADGQSVFTPGEDAYQSTTWFPSGPSLSGNQGTPEHTYTAQIRSMGVAIPANEAYSYWWDANGTTGISLTQMTYATNGSISNVDGWNIGSSDQVSDYAMTANGSAVYFSGPVGGGSAVVGTDLQSGASQITISGFSTPTVMAMSSDSAVGGSTISSSSTAGGASNMQFSIATSGNAPLYGGSSAITIMVPTGFSLPTSASAYTIGGVASPYVQVANNSAFVVVPNTISAGSTATVAVAGVGNPTAPGSYSFQVADSVDSIPVAAGSETIVPGPPVSFKITGTPASDAAGTPITETLTYYDQYGNVCTNLSGTHSVTLSNSGTADSAMDGTASLSISAGVGSFTTTPHIAQSTALTFTDTSMGNYAQTTGTISVVPGTPTKLVLSAPSSSTAGTSLSIGVTAYDAYGNQTSNYNGTDTVAISNSGTADLNRASFPTSVSLSSGVGTVSVTLETAQSTALTISDSTTGATGATASIAVSPAAAAKITVSNLSAATAGVSFNATVNLEDQYGNIETGYSGADTISVSNSGMVDKNAGNFPTSANFSTGVASVPITLETAQSTALTIDDSTYSFSGVGGAVVVVPGAPAQIVVSAPGTATAGSGISLSLKLYDAYGNLATNYSASDGIAVTNSGTADYNKASFPTTATFSSGAASVPITLETAQSTILSVSDSTHSISSSSGAVSVSPGPISKLLVSSPSSGVAGDPFSVKVTVSDAYGNTETSVSGNDTIAVSTLASDSNNANYPTSITYIDGVGSLGVTLDTAQANSVSVADSTLSVSGTASTGTTIVPNTPVKITVSSSPSSVTAGNIASIVLKAYDAYGNLATNYTHLDALAITNSGTADQNASSFPTAASFASGQATLGVVLETAQSTALTIADSTISASVTSASITVQPGAPAGLVIALPSTATAGNGFSVAVKVYDKYGNLATNYSATDSITVTNSDTADYNQANFPTSIVFSSGSGSLGVTLETAQSTALTVSDSVTGVSGASGAITVSPGVAATLVASAPTTTTAGKTAAITLKVEDAYGNLETGYTGNDTISVSNSGTVDHDKTNFPTTASFSNGVANVGVVLETAQSTALSVNDSTLGFAGSTGSVTVQPGAPASLTVSGASSSTAGTTVSFTATAYDAYDNLASNYTTSGVVLAVTNSGAQDYGYKSFPTTANFSSGVATVDVTLDTAQSTSVTLAINGASGSSQPISVTPGSPAVLELTYPTGSVAGKSLTVTATVYDSYQNIETGYTQSDTVSLVNSGTADLNSGNFPTTASFTGGVASLSVVLETAQQTKLTITDGTLSGSGGLVSVQAGAPTRITASAPANWQAGKVRSITLTAYDAYGNQAADYNNQDAVSISNSGVKDGDAANFPLTATFTSGVAVVPVTLDTAQSTVLAITDGGMTASSGTILVAPGASASLAVSAPSATTAGQQLTVKVTMLDAYGNTETGYSGTDTVAFTNSGTAEKSLPTSVVFTNGVGSARVTLDIAQSTKLTVDDSTSAVSGVSGAISVAPGIPASLAVDASSAAVAGTSTTLKLIMLDAYGNTVSSYTQTDAIKITNSGTADSSASGFPTSASFTDGVADVSVTLGTTQTTTLTVTDGALLGSSLSITVASAPIHTSTTQTTTASATVGASGGTVTNPTGSIVLNVPSGAFSGGTSITVTTSTPTSATPPPPAQMTAALVVTINSGGVEPTKPVPATFTVPQSVLNSVPAAEIGIYYYSPISASWSWIGGTVDVATGTISVVLPHFSLYAVMASNVAYNDISTLTSSQQQAVLALTGAGIMQGVGVGQFDPTGVLNRAQFVTILDRLAGLQVPTQAEAVFNDVPNGAWYASYVQAGYDAGLIKGIGNGQFGPMLNVSRQELAVFLNRLLIGKTVSGTATPYQDQSSIASWASAAVARVSQAGIMGASTGEFFNPQGEVSRVDAAVALYNYLKFIGKL